ncbi:hypothetical protein E1B28_009637 [Marasmius oreades]|uniref:Protein ZIP4 homolog n=1 Tax=Marasmius oreades TaxID=181124 RepID=A0A9P7UQN6_9AGAR|nr:uncharacterized protein E1B28_009637 [Marasmius oreades]KAG7090528.1 hypothetical protein E1B28_009637 [Marasmius oreades]
MSGSTRKKKGAKGPQDTFESIKDLLTTTKAQLSDDANISIRPSLIQNLHRVAALAETFSEQRPKSGKEWDELADTLDQEGVSLWNISGLVRKFPEDDGRALVAALRLAAFRLVEAGLEVDPGVETLLNVLQIASKTGSALSDIGKNEMASSVLSSAAKFEEMLRVISDPDGSHRQPKACATIVYFSSRMEAAWKEGNYTVAEFMSRKILDEQQLTHLPAHDRLSLAAKLHAIGKSMLKDGTTAPRNNACDAVVWLQRAFTLLDQLDDTTTPVVSQLKIPILRTLARAYFLSESYDRAETTLQELIPTIDSSTDHDGHEYQELRWLRLAVLKRRKATDGVILDAFKSIIDHMVFSDITVTDILQDLRTLAQRHTLVTAVNQQLLRRAFESTAEFVHRILLSLIIHCSKDEDQDRAIETIDAAFTSVLEAEFRLDCVPATACISLLWQYGDRHYSAKRWLPATKWFLSGTHRLLKEVCPTSSSKCYRKAALCHIEQKEYAKASAVIRCCPTNEAATHYVLFLSAVHQGLEDEASKALHGMVEAPDFDRKMLLLATQLSHELEMKSVLLNTLEALLRTLKASQSGETAVEAMVLLRCIIRLALKLLLEPTANKGKLIDNVVNHFHTARILVNSACEQKSMALIIKDVSWLWRTAYNCAVQGCSEWEGHQGQICDLFDVARDLLEAWCQGDPVDLDSDLYTHLIYASFSGVSGRVFAAREQMSTEGVMDAGRMREISAEINRCITKVSEILESDRITDESDALRTQYILYSLRIFGVEMRVQLKDWEEVLKIVGTVVKSGPLAVGTYEAIADILWVANDCPVNVLYAALEAILHASLDNSALSVEKFSRWLRALCTILLARNAPADRIKAIGYVEQAASVMEEYSEGDEAYPMDERFWLLATAYNTGLECLEASLLDEAKRWFETSTVICKFVSGGVERAEKISETYTRLLARYTQELGPSS